MLLSAGALTAAAAGLRSTSDPSVKPTIDDTLTRDEAGCAGISSLVWHPLSGLDYTGRLRIRLPGQFGGALAIYAGSSVPLDLEASSEQGDPVPINHERLILGPGVFVPPDFWLDDGSPLAAPRHVSHLLLDASGEATRTVVLSLGRRAPRVLARAIGYPPAVRVPICAEPMAAEEIYFATGWYGQEHDPEIGPVRWMQQHGAVLVTSADGRAARVRVRLAPAAESEAPQLSVRVNETYDLKPFALRPGFQEYELHIPDEAWVEGSNELFLSVSHVRTVNTRVRGIAVASLHVQ
jgi:hypothetical protein